MTIEKTPIQDLVIINPSVFNDERGYFLKPITKRNSKRMELILTLFKTINRSLKEG